MKLEHRKKPLFGEHKYSPKKLIRELSEHPDVLDMLAKYPPQKSFGRNSKNPAVEYLNEIVATPSATV
ncbi:hypothetical protein KKA14_04090, partial [bacterium]|nr:hypothetical protein [bacterium]